MVTFFDENHARAIGIASGQIKNLFFTLLSVFDRLRRCKRLVLFLDDLSGGDSRCNSMVC